MDLLKNLHWIDHAGFYITSGSGTLFIDPFRIADTINEKADIIFITHPHFDHCSEADINKIAKSTTKFVVAGECENAIKHSNTTHVKPGSKLEIDNLRIEAVPAYNIKKERLNFHPKSNAWVGYVIEIEGEKIYHAGDTDFIEDMKTVRTDIALLPIGGTYTMDVNEAITAAKAINAKHTVPMHYKILLGKEKAKEAEQEFVNAVNGAKILTEAQKEDYNAF